MSTQSLSAVSLETIHLYANAAKAIVGAYRVGTTRTLQGLEGRLAGGLSRDRMQLSESFKSSLLAAEQQIASLVHGGLEAAASVYERAIEAAEAAATTGVGSVAAAASQLQNGLPGNSAQALIALQMPRAQLSRDLAARVAGAVQQVADRVVDRLPATEVTARTVPTKPKRARTSAKN